MIHITGSFEYRNREAVYVACENGDVYLAYSDNGVLGKYFKKNHLNSFGAAIEYADVAARGRKKESAN